MSDVQKSIFSDTLKLDDERLEVLSSTFDQKFFKTIEDISALQGE